ncbi:MAG: EthD domain-containing protein [Janthinobacterium lividum]
MIKRMAFMARKPETSPEYFSRYWLDVHGDLVKRSPGVNRYQQNVVLDEIGSVPGHGKPFRLDGVVELWFEDEAALQACFASPTGRELPADEERFLEKITMHDVADAAQPDGRYKLLLAAAARAGTEIANVRAQTQRLSRLVSEALGDGASAVINEVEGVRARPNLGIETPPAAVFLQFLFADEATARAAIASQAVHRALTEGAQGFEKVGAYLVFERRVV